MKKNIFLPIVTLTLCSFAGLTKTKDEQPIIVFDIHDTITTWRKAASFGNAAKEFWDAPGELKWKMAKAIFKPSTWKAIGRGKKQISGHGKYYSIGQELGSEIDPGMYDLIVGISNARAPINGMPQLIKLLHDKGYELYVASNIGGDVYEELKKKYPFFEYFSGAMTVDYSKSTGKNEKGKLTHVTKNTPEYWQEFARKFDKKRAPIVFLDDKKDIITTAQKTFEEMKGIDFTGIQFTSIHEVLDQLIKSKIITPEDKALILQSM